MKPVTLTEREASMVLSLAACEEFCSITRAEIVGYKRDDDLFFAWMETPPRMPYVDAYASCIRVKP